MNMPIEDKTLDTDEYREYEIWKTTILQGLVETTTPPSDTLYWEHISRFGPGTGKRLRYPLVGDTWFSAQAEGTTVYKCAGGIKTNYYAPRELVSLWCEDEWSRLVGRYGEADAARRALMLKTWDFSEGLYIREEDSSILAYLGTKYFADLARASEWLIPADLYDPITTAWCLRTARQFDISYALMERIDGGTRVLDEHDIKHNIHSTWMHPNGTPYALTQYALHIEREPFALMPHGRWVSLPDALERVVESRYAWRVERDETGQPALDAETRHEDR